MMSTEQKKCKDIVSGHCASRLEVLTDLLKLYCEDPEAYHDEHQTNLDEYALCFDYVPANTFADQDSGYFRYQLSYGGPSDEFRYYCDPEYNPIKIEYWHLDWGDGACEDVTHNETARELWDVYLECGAQYKFEEATQ